MEVQLSKIFPFVSHKKIPPELANKSYKDDPLRYKFDIEQVEDGEYIGFEVSGSNSRIILSDFTVSHNCKFLIKN